MKHILIVLGLFPFLAFGQERSTLLYIDSTISYGIQLELGPTDVPYAAEVFAVCQSASSRDTLHLGDRTLYFQERMPQVLSVVVFVKASAGLPPYIWVVFDSLTSATTWFLPSLKPYKPDSLFEEDSNGNILLVSKPVNSIIGLSRKPYIKINYVKRVCYGLPGRNRNLWSKPPDLESEVKYGQDRTDFVFRNPWVDPRN